MKTKIILLVLIFSFAGLIAQQKEGAKLQKADESGFIEVDKAPALISQMMPEYPKLAKLAGIEGTVYLKLLIDEKGNVAKAKVEQGVKDMLDESALKAANKAKFSPALLKDKPVKVWIVLPIAYKLSVDKKETPLNIDGEYPDPNTMVPYEKGPELIKPAVPVYPEGAKKNNITGKVFVKVLVDKEGNPKKAMVIKSEAEIFNQSAIDAAMKSKFSPAMDKANPVAVWIVLPYKFALADKEEVNEDIPNVSWMISTKEEGYLEEALDKKLQGKVILKALFNKDDKSIKRLDLIEGTHEILNKAAIEYANKNLQKLIDGYESVRKKYYKQRPKGVKEPKEIKDALIITLLYEIEE